MATAALASLAVLVLTVGGGYASPPVQGTHTITSRSMTPISTKNQDDCAASERLNRLRQQMRDAGISAYIVTSSDDHQSEYLAERDKRREYISQFTGSAGDAVVTLNAAALWTDSRYFIQAEQELDCNWILMRSGVAGTPTMAQWIIQQLEEGGKVSSDPRIASYTEWNAWNTSFASSGIELELLHDNLVDKIWGADEGRENYPDDELIVLDVNFTGIYWQEKLTKIRNAMTVELVDTFVVTKLDEIAWALNLRGGDVPYTPLFRSYLIIGQTYATLYLPADKMTNLVLEHLNSNSSDTENSIRVKEYDAFWADLSSLDGSANRILLTSPFSYSKGSSYYVYYQLSPDNVKFAVSPILLMKDIKNDVEAEGMRNAHIKDAVALCQMMRILEDGIHKGEDWDELRVVATLDDLRTKQLYNRGISFTTISAFGPNAALPHYVPNEQTNLKINSSSVFMLDSGGQYYDGTTDVTRTLHFGTPTEFQRSVYTHLLMGCIDLVTTRFPEGQTQSRLDLILRAPLYSLGLDYGHGSTHGIGAFLGVHEAFNTTLHKNFFGSQEPGFYQSGSFGMRLENIVTVVSANLTFEGKEFFTFDAVTLVPYEERLIDLPSLSHRQLKWLNDYHARVRQIVGDEMVRQNLIEDHAWLLGKTVPLSVSTNSAPLSTSKWGLLIFSILFSSLLSSNSS